jgi:hypothetical protein
VQLLDDPRLIQLAWELSTGPDGHRATIRRGALCDDDPLLAEFATLDLLGCESQKREVDEAPFELWLAWSRPEQAFRTHDALPQLILTACRPRTVLANSTD